jgi:hypothetical protein
MSVHDVDGAIRLIKDWIEQRGISAGIKIDPTPEDFYFQFTGKDEAEIPFTIFQPKGWKKTILILSQVEINEDRVKSIESMRLKDRDEFLYNFQKDISFAPANIAFDPSFDETGIPRGIQFQSEICYDGLTEDRLNDAMRNVVKCTLFVIWRIRKEFGNPKKE